MNYERELQKQHASMSAATAKIAEVKYAIKDDISETLTAMEAHVAYLRELLKKY